MPASRKGDPKEPEEPQGGSPPRLRLPPEEALEDLPRLARRVPVGPHDEGDAVVLLRGPGAGAEQREQEIRGARPVGVAPHAGQLEEDPPGRVELRPAEPRDGGEGRPAGGPVAPPLPLG